ncbi:hypothetical protein Sjap_006775 [Stephania japonica]|uniref:Uncharacterized protein n=1 Tax=Stephania japonica TaxID=461633 RepID=A0AAP0PK24_9MAGN
MGNQKSGDPSNHKTTHNKLRNQELLEDVCFGEFTEAVEVQQKQLQRRVDIGHGMKNLRILDLSGNKSLETLPDSMDKYMEHLKQLNLRDCGLSSLPGESLSGMKNLQILDLTGNRRLKTLPDSIGKYIDVEMRGYDRV